MPGYRNSTFIFRVIVMKQGYKNCTYNLRSIVTSSDIKIVHTICGVL